VAHKLAAEIAIARGDLVTGEAALNRALEELCRRPVPVLEWKIWLALGRLKIRMNDPVASRTAFARAGEIVDKIAANVDDRKLREIFLTSGVAREIRSGALGIA
jgi:hypothetical protein